MNKPTAATVAMLIALSALSALSAQLAGCATGPSTVPVINKSPHRLIPTTAKVQPGDSVYSIAWRFGLDYQKIVTLNRLSKPHYPIRSGQLLRLPRPSSSLSAVAANVPVAANATVATGSAPVAKPQTSAPPKQQTPLRQTTALSTTDPSKWNWPAKGKLLNKFSPNDGRNGINIAGTAGSPVRATAAGEVVYAGEGLRGYGKLIIVKHSATYLSAYAHNRKIMVKEGERIRAVQQIAQMGHSEADRTMLHFEIRKNGTPVDPLRFLN